MWVRNSQYTHTTSLQLDDILHFSFLLLNWAAKAQGKYLFKKDATPKGGLKTGSVELVGI